MTDSLRRLAQQPTTGLLIAVLLGAWVLRLVTLDAYPLVDTTEGRYAEIAREMREQGEWVMPIFDLGEPFMGKPPLWFWATSLSQHFLGNTGFASRFASFLFCLSSVILTMAVAKRLYGARSALMSGIILSTCGLLYFMSGGVLLDPALLATLTLSMAGGVVLIHAQSDSDRNFGTYLCFAGMGLAVLSKGLVGLVLPVAACGVWVLWNWRFDLLPRLPFVKGIFLFAAIAVPWHLWAEARVDGFLHYYIIGEHFSRYLDRGWEGDMYGNPHAEPKGMIWIFALVAALPWSLLLPLLLWKRRAIAMRLTSSPEQRFLLCWMLTPLVFFSLSDNIIITYCVPILPPFAILMDRWLNAAMKAIQSTDLPEPWFLRPGLPVAVAATVIIVLNLISLAVAPFFANRRSQQELVEQFEERRRSPTAELIYVDKMPHSGDFYAEGVARLIDDSATVGVELNDGQEDFFAVDDDRMDRFEQWKNDPRIQEIGHYANTYLYREIN
jgi:4-amino-4-deoxy-L-arabinose transferase-like glycosyltransferase